MDKKIRLGVIGVGMAWQRLHWPALEQMKDKFEVVAVCNRTIDKAMGFADSIGLAHENVYDDMYKMLCREDIDAVDTLVPISENFEAARAVIQAGKHLIAEKPFASTEEEAKQLIQLKNEKNVTVLVAENCRYDEGNYIIKELLSAGAIGDALYFIQNVCSDFEKDMTENTFAAKEWRQHPDYKGGILLDGGIHDFARMRYLFGEIEGVHSAVREWDRDYNPYSVVSVLVRFKNGVHGFYALNAQGKELQKPPVGLRIYGTQGEIYLESKDKGVIEVFKKDGTSEQKTFAPNNGYYHEFINFYNALTKGEMVVSTAEKELGDIRAVMACV